MKLPQKALQEFKELYRSKYGKELSDKEASIMAIELLNLYRLSQQININNEY
jgi:hypothetical protein